MAHTQHPEYCYVTPLRGAGKTKSENDLESALCTLILTYIIQEK